MIPQTRYARTVDGVHIAYQVLGDGPVDLVSVMGWTSNVEAIREEPGLAREHKLKRHPRPLASLPGRRLM